ncbi:SMI1 / KNR4 family (SUKH-1) [Paenibacillus tianmuensis]|uniref:SMI1 / KNR4 family (SUKH-1) n=1 Tax=Paenibacillus tianmuensis TaxID=624147 RepID=A0A1G4RKY0_9BACL|nr:SMI1/KNR4 family protein [Paenibacillus tianmuensis]SCW57460.1 SMI1 / KNR4 family (SUKH-1) [Paenibacillus tianmuensis]
MEDTGEEYFKPLTMERLVEGLKVISQKEAEVYHQGTIVTYSMRLNPPANPIAISLMEEDINIKFPKDYSQFLSLVNGMDFGNQNTRVCSLERIHEFYVNFDIYYENMIVIATALGASVHIIMEVKDDGNYRLYVTDVLGEAEMWYLGDDLLKFLDALVSSYGYPFWEWNKKSSEYLIKQFY